ncbi:xanthine dehydrogenase family protein subunit M [Streptomyces sp. NPDC001941]|uniref:FAD binding domain-containing protein n=1 Tax=Streptomyces sp. NPDC001941 TaxID=3154659 RepID=UPI0033245519
MKAFDYLRPTALDEALAAAGPGVAYLAGGTNLVDLMRAGVETPHTVVDLTALPLDGIEETGTGGLRVGALVRNSRLAADPRVRDRFPLLAQAVLAGASPQLRNMATVGGNLLQRTRCPYFQDTAARCNRRLPGAGCDAAEGLERAHAVLGASPHCVAVHPSDLCVALAALDAEVEIHGRAGPRTVPAASFHLLPGTTPHRENALEPGELVTAVVLPGEPAMPSAYRKVRDRASFAFALVSVAAALDVRSGRVARVRLALGGVAARPWRAHAAERALTGAPATEAAFRRAVAVELERGAGGHVSRNTFKRDMALRLAVAVLRDLAAPGDRAVPRDLSVPREEPGA